MGCTARVATNKRVLASPHNTEDPKAIPPMKAKTIRPLLMLLLFGFFPTSGWMIVRSGPDTTGVPAASGTLPAGATPRPHAGLPGPAIPTPPGASAPSAVAAYGRPSASNAPAAGPSAPSGASISPTAAPDPSGAIDSSGDPVAGSGDYAFSSSDGFGDFGIPDSLPGGSGGDPGGADNVQAPGGTLPSTHSGSDTGGNGTRGGSGGSGNPGHSGGPSGNGSGSLLDPPGATGGTGTNGSNPISGSNTHQATVPEPSTLALFLAGAAALGLALRRRLRR